MLRNRIVNDLAMMNSQIIQNQKDLLAAIFDQPASKFDKYLCVLLVDQESDLVLVCNRADRTDPLTLRVFVAG